MANSKLIENGWFYEKNHTWPGMCNGWVVKSILATKQSKFQDILLFESDNNHVVLVTDGVVQFHTLWEHIYHEMIAHVPLFAHPNPQTVLIIGGGDGGCAREILKHESIQKVVWIEIDEEIIKLTKEFCPTVHPKEIYNDRRLELRIEDGIKYVKECSAQSFDIIIVDGSDPIDAAPSTVLFTKEFYAQCHRILNEGGLINNQCDFMFADGSSGAYLGRTMSQLRSVFHKGEVKYLSMYTPMYTGGQLGCVLARKYSHSMQAKYGTNAVDAMYREIPDSMYKTLKYYSAKMHSASFILPNKIDSTLSKL